MFLIFIAEAFESTDNRKRRTLAKSAQSHVLNHICKLFQLIQIGHLTLAIYDSLQDLQHTFGTLTARYTFTAALTLGEVHKESGNLNHTGILVHNYQTTVKAEADAGFYAPGPFRELVEKPEGVISLGAKMGEGWLLTAEMIELVQGGYGNIVCAQPFGCLPNHIVGKGMVNKIRAMYPGANITPIDYDPSATRVNQENRIKLMLAVAKERLNAPAEAKLLTAEEIAGGAPSLSHV